jgi:hypothetical protein
MPKFSFWKARASLCINSSSPISSFKLQSKRERSCLSFRISKCNSSGLIDSDVGTERHRLRLVLSVYLVYFFRGFMALNTLSASSKTFSCCGLRGCSILLTNSLAHFPFKTGAFSGRTSFSSVFTTN